LTTTDTLRVNTHTSDATSEEEIVLLASASVARATLLPDGVPFMIPLGQDYYWSAPWQRGLRESMQALEAGDFETFDSDDPNDAVRWLFSDDDDG
jgi:hypothetical protein